MPRSAKKRKWMQRAVSRPGAVRSKAKRAHMSTHQWEEKHKHDSGRSGKQARLGLTFAKYRGKKRKTTRSRSR